MRAGDCTVGFGQYRNANCAEVIEWFGHGNVERELKEIENEQTNHATDGESIGAVTSAALPNEISMDPEVKDTAQWMQMALGNHDLATEC